MKEATYDLSQLEKSRTKWIRSRSIRLFYGDLFSSAIAYAVPGPTLELGAGIGRIKEYFPEVVTSDIEKTPYVDCAASCYELHELDSVWQNFLAIDVLHHLTQPFRFFASAAGSLRPGGRIILVEPAATAWGTLFYRLCHHEPIAPRRLLPPFEFKPDTATGEFANMGMGVSLFSHHRKETSERLRSCKLKLQEVRYRDILAYPLTGGLSKPALAPISMINRLMRWENRRPQRLLRHLGLRMIIVLEKTHA